MPEPSKAIIKAAKSGDLEKVKGLLAADPALLHARDTDGSTPLHCAAWKGHEHLVVFLLDAGADANVQNNNDHWGTTPLHAAAHANHARIVEALIEGGAALDAHDSQGKTPLHHTTIHKATAAAKVLQKHGAR
jgi:ankyrin repeat protein